MHMIQHFLHKNELFPVKLQGNSKHIKLYASVYS